ncbi:MAG: flippase-like domain-containing protein [Clostridia bacterium]|nr:flippase-like domain-containing protein [Clostridia bacterium]
MKNKKYLISAIVLVIVICLTMYALLKDYKISEIVDSILGVNPVYIVLCVLMVIMYSLFEGIGLKVVLRTFGTKIGYFKGFVYGNIDLFFSLITPSSTGGQPVMAYYMSKDDIPVSQSTMAILLNTLNFKAVLITLSTAVLAFMPELIFENGTLVTVLFFAGYGMQLLMGALCFMAMFWQSAIRKISFVVIRLLGRMKIIKDTEKVTESFGKSLDDYAQCATFIKGSRSIVPKVYVVNLIQRVFLFTIGYLVYLGFGQSSLNYFEVVGIQAAIAMAANFLPIPGASGITEVVFMLLYSSIYPEKELLLSALLLTRIFDYYFSLLMSGGVSLGNHLSVRKRNKKEGSVQ